MNIITLRSEAREEAERLKGLVRQGVSMMNEAEREDVLDCAQTAAWDRIKFSELYKLDNEIADAKAKELTEVLMRTMDEWIIEQECKLAMDEAEHLVTVG